MDNHFLFDQDAVALSSFEVTRSGSDGRYSSQDGRNKPRFLPFSTQEELYGSIPVVNKESSLDGRTCRTSKSDASDTRLPVLHGVDGSPLITFEPSLRSKRTQIGIPTPRLPTWTRRDRDNLFEEACSRLLLVDYSTFESQQEAAWAAHGGKCWHRSLDVDAALDSILMLRPEGIGPSGAQPCASLLTNSIDDEFLKNRNPNGRDLPDPEALGIPCRGGCARNKTLEVVERLLSQWQQQSCRRELIHENARNFLQSTGKRLDVRKLNITTASSGFATSIRWVIIAPEPSQWKPTVAWRSSPKDTDATAAATNEATTQNKLSVTECQGGTGGGSSRAARSTQSEKAASGSSQSASSECNKRARRCAKGDNGDGNDEPPERGRKGIGPKRPRSAVDMPERIACPWIKRYPHQFSAQRACWCPGFQDFAKMKEHLDRNHTYKYYCQRCSAPFDTEEELTRHTQSPEWCQPGAPQRRVLGFMSKKQAEALKLQLKNRRVAKDLEAKWAIVWRILFPGVADIPSPYFDQLEIFKGMRREVEVDREAFLKAQLPSQLRAKLDADPKMRALPEDIKAQFMEMLLDVVLDMLQKHIQGFCARAKSCEERDACDRDNCEPGSDCQAGSPMAQAVNSPLPIIKDEDGATRVPSLDSHADITSGSAAPSSPPASEDVPRHSFFDDASAFTQVQKLHEYDDTADGTFELEDDVA